jgi:hypothetical protein
LAGISESCNRADESGSRCKIRTGTAFGEAETQAGRKETNKIHRRIGRTASWNCKRGKKQRAALGRTA